MKTSVLMPCLNTPGRFIDEAVASVFRQNRDIELLIQDGGSSRPDTLAALERASSDPRAKVASERDRGQSDALNRSLMRATGEAIAWLNADDVFIEENLTGLIDLVEANPYLNGGYGDFQVLRADGEILRECDSGAWDYDRIFRKGCYIFSGSLVLRRDLLEKSGAFNTDLHYCMDLDLYLRLGRKPRLVRLNQPVAALRIHDQSKTGALGKKFAREGLMVRKQYATRQVDMALAYQQFLLTRVTVATTAIRYSRAYSKFRRRRTLG